MAAGTKHDGGKPRPSLVLGTMARAIRAVIDVAEHGAQKYSADNWLQVPDGINRYTDAMLRHLGAEQAGEAEDGDSGLLHAAHAAWGALARLDLMLRKAEQDAVHIADRVTAPAHAVDAMRYTFGADLGETAAELRAKRDAAEHQAVRACAAELRAKRDAAEHQVQRAAEHPVPKRDPTLNWPEQLVRWLRYYSHTFSKYEAEGLLRAEYARNTESLRVAGVAKRRYDGILAVIHDLPTDGTAVGGVEALGLAVDRAVAHWDELAKQSATKLGGIAFSERVGRRAEGSHYGTFSQWAQQVEARIVNRAPSISDVLFDKLRAISPLFVRLETQRQLIATYDCNTSRLAIKGVEGGQYEGFDVGMLNINPGARNFDDSMRNLVTVLGLELCKVDQRRANQAQRDFEQRKAAQVERERRERVQQEEALLRRHHLAATNPVRICRAKLKHILSAASLPVTRRLEQLRRADRLRLELQGGELRLIVCDPNGAALVCLHQVVDPMKSRLTELELATTRVFSKLLSVSRLESLITPVPSKR